MQKIPYLFVGEGLITGCLVLHVLVKILIAVFKNNVEYFFLKTHFFYFYHILMRVHLLKRFDFSEIQRVSPRNLVFKFFYGHNFLSFGVNAFDNCPICPLADHLNWLVLLHLILFNSQSKFW